MGGGKRAGRATPHPPLQGTFPLEGKAWEVPRLRARDGCHGQSADWSRNDRYARRQIFLVKPIDIVGFMCYHALTYKKKIC